MAEGLTCVNHPRAPTNLRCSKCEKPICAACAVQTPVGLRCRECAQLRRLPIYDVSPLQYARATGTAVGLGLITGLGWSLFRAFPVFGFAFYLSFIIALGIGYVMGEAVSLSVNRKRGRGLQVVAALGVFLSYLVSRMPLLAMAQVSLAGAGIERALLDPFGLLAVAIGIYLAASRIR